MQYCTWSGLVQMGRCTTLVQASGSMALEAWNHMSILSLIFAPFPLWRLKCSPAGSMHDTGPGLSYQETSPVEYS